MDLKEYSRLVESYYKLKLTFHIINYDTNTIECILYNSFYLEFSIAKESGDYSFAIAVGNQMYRPSKVIGQDIILDGDLESIITSMDIIDKYCRLRLPDKFLEEFDKFNNG